MSSTTHSPGNQHSIPAPHFKQAKRKASAWKTEEVAAANSSSLEVAPSIGPINHTIEVVSPGTLEELSPAESPSPSVTERADLTHSELASPHFYSRGKHRAGDYGSYLVPLGDESMRPPEKTVPAAESFGKSMETHSNVDPMGFRPNWEVDQFLWPEVTTELLYQHDQLFSDFATLIEESILNGQKRMVMTGVRRGEGRTTLSIAIARKLSHDGKRVLIVDVDLSNPQLADAMGIDSEVTWLSDQSTNISSAELLIGNHESDVCLMPLTPPQREEYARHAYEILDDRLQKIEPYFDALILEFGPISQVDLATFRKYQLAHAGLFVHDPLVSTVEQYADAFQKFQALNLVRFGFVENGAVQTIQNVV